MFESEQELADHVIRALIKQGRPSVAFDGSGLVCRYIGEDRCAAGHCIPEILERWVHEGVDWFSQHKVLTEAVGHADLVAELQEAHDAEYNNPELWRRGFRVAFGRVLRGYGLSEAVLDEIPGDWA